MLRRGRSRAYHERVVEAIHAEERALLLAHDLERSIRVRKARVYRQREAGGLESPAWKFQAIGRPSTSERVRRISRSSTRPITLFFKLPNHPGKSATRTGSVERPCVWLGFEKGQPLPLLLERDQRCATLGWPQGALRRGIITFQTMLPATRRWLWWWRDTGSESGHHHNWLHD
jgi:hypothetical protein